MNYIDKLKNSALESGNIVCMGLDPVLGAMSNAGSFDEMASYLKKLIESISKSGLKPAAFKPNIGYYAVFDSPYEGNFQGSLLLRDIILELRDLFPYAPIILDTKRGDIAKSSDNYSKEAFDIWQADAVTVSPYMGTDSVSPFFKEDKGVYVLDRTSNPGSSDFQSRSILDKFDERELNPLFIAVAHQIAFWSNSHKGIGAVLGATGMKELEEVASYFSSKEIPILVPGVGSQGGSAEDVIDALKRSHYPVELCRINSSSSLTHPWKKGPIPQTALESALESIRKLINEASI